MCGKCDTDITSRSEDGTALLSKNDTILALLGAKWHTWRDTSEGLDVLYSVENDSVIYAPMYVHKFCYHTPVHEFLQDYPELTMDMSIADKLKWCRLNAGLQQKEAAAYLEIDRATYAKYEEGVLAAYPTDKLRMLADLYRIEAESLMDEYHLFLFHVQGTQLKMFRRENAMTQKDLADLLNVSTDQIKNWEQVRIRMGKKSFEKLRKYSKSF